MDFKKKKLFEFNIVIVVTTNWILLHWKIFKQISVWWLVFDAVSIDYFFISKIFLCSTVNDKNTHLPVASSDCLIWLWKKNIKSN